MRRNIFGIIFGIFIFMIGFLAYFSPKDLYWNNKVYGIGLIIFGIIIVINYLIDKKPRWNYRKMSTKN